MIAFVDELTKLGGYGGLIAGGAGLGALANVARHRLSGEEQRPGSTLGQAIRGALVGGGLTAGGVLATQGGREAAKKSVGNLFQRERYHLTGQGLGKTPEEQLAKAKEIGLIGATPAAADYLKEPGIVGRTINKMRGKLPKTQLSKYDEIDLARRTAMHQGDIEHFQKGYKSMPGVLHGLLSKNEAGKLNAPDVLKSSWQRMDPVGKAFTGLGAYEAVKGFTHKPQEGEPGRMEAGLRGIGRATAGMVAPGMVAPGMLMHGIGGTLGGAGKAMDVGASVFKRRGHVVPAAETQPMAEAQPVGY